MVSGQGSRVRQLALDWRRKAVSMSHFDSFLTVYGSASMAQNPVDFMVFKGRKSGICFAYYLRHESR